MVRIISGEAGQFGRDMSGKHLGTRKYKKTYDEEMAASAKKIYKETDFPVKLDDVTTLTGVNNKYTESLSDEYTLDC